VKTTGIRWGGIGKIQDLVREKSKPAPVGVKRRKYSSMKIRK
jgi:hypothetical protein